MIERIHTQGTPLDNVRSIEAKLVELWREVGDAERPTMRARVMTMVIVAEAEREAEMADAMMALAARHPARHVLLLLGNGEPTLEADTMLLCQNSGARLCAEQVHILTRGDAYTRLPAAVRALLVPDLPVVGWWALSPTDERIDLCDALAEMTDYLFFDTGFLCEPGPLAELGRHWFDMDRRDLAWARLTPWRELVARPFDAPTVRPLLATVERVEIECGRCPLHGWLMLGWLASSLKWKARDTADNEVRYERKDGAELVATVTTRRTDDRLRAIKLSGPDFALEVVRGRSGTAISTLKHGNLRQRETLNLEHEKAVVTLSREIDNMQHMRTYADSVAAIRRALQR